MKLNSKLTTTSAIIPTAPATLRSKNNFVGRWALMAGLMGLSALIGAPAYGQESGCTSTTVSGNYGVLASGTLLGSGRLAAVGLLITNGPGRFVYKLVQNIAGTVSSETLNGTYTLYPDCTGVVNFENGQVFAALVVNGGNEIDLVSTVPAALIQTAVAKRTP